MALLNIVTAPDPILKKISEPVLEVTDELRTFMYDMLDTMKAGDGVGLAAIQVGVPKQIIAIDLTEDDEHDHEDTKHLYPLFLINTKIIWSSDEYAIATEGCLSVPSIMVDVPRPDSIKIEYMNVDGKDCTLEAHGWLARVIQHEVDHQNGRIILHYLSSLKKDLALNKLKKFKKQLV